VTHDSRRFLPPEAVARISRLEVEARGIVEGFLSGLHRSPYFGQSVEFVQHREYVPGDDPRRIDWKQWSKTDRFYIKQYEEDTNLRCLILVDGSESMQYGSVAPKAGGKSKFEYACSIAACLAYLLLRQQDSVGLIRFDQSIRTVVPPRAARHQLHDILGALYSATAEGKTSLQEVLKRAADVQTQKGLVVLLSDLFADRASLDQGLKLLRYAGHEVLVFHILDDEELDFQSQGMTKFEGMEGLDDLICDPRALREGYLAAMQEFLDEVRRNCARQMVDYQVIRTSSNLDAVLAKYLANRLGLAKKRA
jgi:uncharacterized protein (DUF58 family)